MTGTERARRRPHYIGVCAVALASFLGGCKQDIQLTRPAPVGPAPAIAVPVKREATTLGFAVPIDLKAAEAIAEAALPQSLGRIVEWFKEAACGKRDRWVECNGARADIDVERNGPVQIAADKGRIVLKVPLKYSLTARGLGWARDIQESRSGELVATLPMKANFAPGFEANVDSSEPVTLSETNIPVLKARADLGRLIEARLKKPLAPALAAVRESLQAEEIKPLAEKAWRALHNPIELAREPQLWLRIDPERISGIDFAGEGERLLLRYTFSARLSATTGERPAPLLPKPLPDLPTARAHSDGEHDGSTELQLPLRVASAPLLAAIRKGFPAEAVLKSALDDSAEPISGSVRHVSLFPARGLLGIELQLDLKAPARWAGMIGTAHFVAKPVVRGETTLMLEAVGLPESGAKPAKGVHRPPTTSPSMPRVGAEPFATAIANAGRMPIGDVVQGLLPSANRMIEQPLGGGFQLGGNFERARIMGVQVIRDGFELTVGLTGRLTLRYVSEQAMAAPAQPAPSVR